MRECRLIQRLTVGLGGLGICFLIAGCVHVSPKQSPALARFPVDRWQVRGVFSLQPTHQRRVMAHFSWQQHNMAYCVEIHSTFGIYNLLLQGSPSGVVLKMPKKSPQRALSPEILLRQQLGWDFPVRYMPYWMRGLPAPNVADFQAHYDARGHLVTLQQSGWKVSLSRYKKVCNLDLPGMLDIESSRKDQGKVAIRIVLRNWFFT